VWLCGVAVWVAFCVGLLAGVVVVGVLVGEAD
jgi:hypothetical protein